MKAAVHYRKQAAGLTLVELLISMTLGVLLLWGSIQIFVAGQQSYNDAQRFRTLQGDLGFISDSLLNDVRGAASVSLNAASDTLTITQGATELTYSRSASNELQRTVTGEAAAVLANSISALSFACLDTAFSVVTCDLAATVRADVTLTVGEAGDAVSQQFRIHMTLRNVVMASKFGGGV